MNDGLSESPRDGGMQNWNTLMKSIQDYRKKTWTVEQGGKSFHGTEDLDDLVEPTLCRSLYLGEVHQNAFQLNPAKQFGKKFQGTKGIDQHVPILQSHQSIHCFCLRMPGFGDKVFKISDEPGDQEICIWQLPTATQVLEHPHVNEQRKSACQLYTPGIYMADKFCSLATVRLLVRP